jgi:hypothetical protein
MSIIKENIKREIHQAIRSIDAAKDNAEKDKIINTISNARHAKGILMRVLNDLDDLEPKQGFDYVSI